MMGVRYMICHWAINRTDPQNSLSTILDVLLQFRSFSYGVPKVFTFTYCNKLTIKIVSKPLMGLTTLM